MNRFARLDHQYVWHPFTQMQDWLKQEPIVITRAKGSVLQDANGKRYLDANSSIWTNLHGHNHPVLNQAIKRQLQKIAHSSALGFANEPASLLAEQLVKIANPDRHPPLRPRLEKIFYSDDGSTALEVALKLAYEFARRSGLSKRPRFLSLTGAYHGDTIGGVSLGKIDLFHKAYSGLLFKTDQVMAPYCYRCPFNRAKPERADAREYRKCSWECVDQVEATFKKRRGEPYSGLLLEPLLQGPAGMIPQPKGWLNKVAQIARRHHTPIIADEVMTGLGRVGGHHPSSPAFFACHQEGVQPDFLAIAKGLTGGYLPMAATLTTQKVFDAFLGDYAELKTFFHGHSFTGNQLGSAAALANLRLLQSRSSIRLRSRLETALRDGLTQLWTLPQVGDIRQVGLVAAIELVKDWRTRKPFPLSHRSGIRVCNAMAQRGVLTRPIGNVIVLMPPYSTSPAQVHTILQSLHHAIQHLQEAP